MIKDARWPDRLPTFSSAPWRALRNRIASFLLYLARLVAGEVVRRAGCGIPCRRGKPHHGLVAGSLPLVALVGQPERRSARRPGEGAENIVHQWLAELSPSRHGAC